MSEIFALNIYMFAVIFLRPTLMTPYNVLCVRSRYPILYKLYWLYLTIFICRFLVLQPHLTIEDVRQLVRAELKGVAKEAASDIASLWRAIVKVGVNKHDGNLWKFSPVEQNPAPRWLGKLSALYVRDDYETIFASLQENENTLVFGTPGIGKSMFLNYVLVKIAELEHSPGDNIVFSRWESGVRKHYWLFMDGSSQECTSDAWSASTYVLSDSVDIDMPPDNRFNLEVSSTSALNYKYFGKNAYPMTVVQMNNVSYEELVAMNNGKLHIDELRFRFEVFGGNARHVLKMKMCNVELPEVSEILSVFYPEVKSAHVDWWLNVCHYICNESTATDSTAHDLAHSISLYRHSVRGGIHVWSSKTMELIATVLAESGNISVLESLRQIFGSSGLGNAFEYHGHKRIIEASVLRVYKIDSKSNRLSSSCEDVSINIANIRRLWNITSIGELERNEYGLPINSTFPLVDAIIQPNILIQFTTSTSHLGAVNKLGDIRSLLIEKDNAMMIFVVPSNILKEFKFQPKLDIPQYVMSVENTAALPPFKKTTKL